MGLFRQKKETTGSIDLSEQSKDASRSRFWGHRRARDESATRTTADSTSETGPMTQRVLRTSPQSKEESSDIRPLTRSGLLFKSRSDSNETGHKDTSHHFSNKRSEPAIPNLSRSRSPPQVLDRYANGANTDPDGTTENSPKQSPTDPKTQTLISSTSSLESSHNVVPSSGRITKNKITPTRSPVLPVSTPIKDEKPAQRRMPQTKGAAANPTSSKVQETPPPSAPSKIGVEAKPAPAGTPSTPVPLQQMEPSPEKERRRITPGKSASHSPTTPGVPLKTTTAEDRSRTPPITTPNPTTAASNGLASPGGGILKKSAFKSPSRAQPKVVNAPVVPSSVSTKTEEPSQSEAPNTEPSPDTESAQPLSPHNSKASSSSTHIRRISLNDSDRPSPKATARKATFAPSAIRTQALRSIQPDPSPQSPTPNKPKAHSVTNTNEPIFDLSPSDSSTQATPTDEGTASSEPPALSKILKSSYAFDPDRRGNLGSPFACPGFDNEGSANELLKALTMRRLKTIKMEKSWAGVGAQDDESEEELPSSRVKIIPRKGQL